MTHRATKYIVLTLCAIFILIVMTNSSYFRIVNNLYRNITKLPQLIVIVVGILSVLGLSNVLDFHDLYNKAKPVSKISSHNIIKNIIPPVDDGKRLVSDTMKKFVAARQKWVCGLCGKMLDETYEVDHIKALYKGGTNDADNLMALDPICHRKKTNADRLNLATGVFI